MLYSLIFIVKKILKGKKSRYILQMLLIILFIPVIILILDMWNFFDKYMPTIYNNIIQKYDMLAFLGAYLSAIVSSLLLIMITNIDREENTKIIQDAPLINAKEMKKVNK